MPREQGGPVPPPPHRRYVLKRSHLQTGKAIVDLVGRHAALRSSRDAGERLTGAKKYLAAAALAAWLIAAIFFLILSHTLDLEIFFVLSFIGFSIITITIDGAFSRPHYMRYLDYIIATGVAIFAYIIAGKILEIIVA